MRTVTEIGPLRIGLPPYLRNVVPPSDLPPIPVADVRTFLRSDGPFDIDVMANDSDPEGLTLTLLSADALHGTASVNPDGTVAYTPPLAPELADIITYVIQDPGGLTSPGTVTITLSDPQISADVSVENTITISATDGIVDITITAPPVFAGDYQMDTADLAAGPVNLAPPDVSGTPTIGGTLSVQDGLWIYDATGTEPVITWQWLRDGADIIGATSESYVLTATDSGTDISVRETATDALGSRSAASPTVSVAAAAGVAATFLSGAASGGTASQSSEILSVDLSGHNGVDDIVIMLGAFGGTSAHTLTDIVLDGVAASQIISTPITSSDGSGTRVACAVIPGQSFAAVSSLSIAASGSFYDAGAACYAVPAGATIALLTQQEESVRAGSDVSGDVSSGETVLAAQIVANGVAPAWTGLVEDYLADIRSGEWFSSASANDLATAAPHAITTTGTTDRTACLSIKIS